MRYKTGGNVRAEIERTSDNPPRYTVSVSGEGAVALYGQLGAEVSAEGEAGLRGGATLEFTANSPEEAARIAETIAREAAVLAAGPLGGPIAEGLIGPSNVERAFLQDRLSAVELRGGIAAEAAATLGMPVTDVSANANLSSELCVRFETPQRNEAGQITQGPRVVVGQTVSGEIQGNLGPGGAQLNGEMQLQQTYELPQNVGMRDLWQNPLESLRRDANETRQVDSSATFTVGGNLRGGIAGVEGTTGMEIEMGIHANPQGILRSGAIDHLFSGNFAGAASDLGNNTRISVKSESVNTLGVDFSPSARIMGFGVGGELKAQLTDHTTLTQREITASELFDTLQPRLQPYLPPYPASPKSVIAIPIILKQG